MATTTGATAGGPDGGRQEDVEDKEKILKLLEALRQACRRPLMEDIHLLHSNQQKWRRRRLRQHELEHRQRMQSYRQEIENKEDVEMVDPPSDPPDTATKQTTNLPEPTQKKPQSEETQKKEDSKHDEKEVEDYEKLSWCELLQEAALVAPFLTDEQHAQVLHCAGVLFVGFLLPHSTGNEHRLLQSINRQQTGDDLDPTDDQQEAFRRFDPVECVIQMSLLDRLDQSSTFHRHFGGHGDSCCLILPHVELAYQDFLQQGLLPLFSSRPWHSRQVDLLHLIAMVICPHSGDVSWSGGESSSPPLLTTTTRQLMRHPAARKFQIHHGHRAEWVHLLAQGHVSHLFPSLSDTAEDVVTTDPWLKGALPHLQASLSQFAQTATTPQDRQAALAAWIALVTPTQNVPLLADTWRDLLHRIVDDPAQYHCRHGPLPTTLTWPLPCCSQPHVADEENLGKVFCSHGLCGQLLAVLMFHSGGCGSALFATALSSLSDTIEWQVDAWARDEAEPDKKPPASPCLQMALLFAARHVLLVAPKPTAERSEEEAEAIETLVGSSLQLLRHPEALIRNEARQVLEVTFGPTPVANPLSYAKPFLDITLSECKRTDKCDSASFLPELNQLIQIMVQCSPAFGKQLTEHLVSRMKENDCLSELEAKLLAILWTHNPAIALQEEDKNDKALLKRSLAASANSSAAEMHFVAAALAKRQTMYFPPSDAAKRASELMSAHMSSTNHWSQYRMACHSMVLGDYCFASLAFESILAHKYIEEDHYLWIATLHQVSQAEHLLASQACNAIPEASCLLHTALSYLHNLHMGPRFAFRSRFLFLRLDYLDLIVILRQLTRETRLTGASPAKHTRHHQHLVHALRGLNDLSDRFRELHQLYGIQFSCRSSRACLFAYGQLCDFLVKATQATFADVLDPLSLPKSEKKTRPANAMPILKLVAELDKLVVKPMVKAAAASSSGAASTMEPLVRAAAMLELLDAMLMAPSPFPKDFFLPRGVPVAELKMSSLPSEVAEWGGATTSVMESYPSISSTLQVNGVIPVELIQHAVRQQRPIVAVLLWCRLLYKCPLDHHQEEEAAAANDGNTASMFTREAIESRIPPLTQQSHFSLNGISGRFHGTFELPPLADEGWFILEARLGCRDCRATEWELHVQPQASLNISIHCSRAR